MGGEGRDAARTIVFIKVADFFSGGGTERGRNRRGGGEGVPGGGGNGMAGADGGGCSGGDGSGGEQSLPLPP